MKFFLLLFSAVIAFSAAADTAEYKFCRELKGTGKGAACTVLDADLYRHTNADYTNIRILDKNGSTVPFTLRVSRERKAVTVYEKEKAVTRYEWGKVHSVAVDLPEIERSTREGKTFITVDAANIPCTRLRISADDSYFSRPVKITAEEKVVASGVVTHEKSTIGLNGLRAEKYLIVIDNGDDKPLKNIKLYWETEKRMIVFLPETAGELKLYYGGNAPSQNYDIDRFADEFAELAVFTPGKAGKNPAYAPSLPREQIFRYVMWGILAVVAAVLLSAIICLGFKKTDPEA